MKLLPRGTHRTLERRSLSPLLLLCEHATNRLPFAAGVGTAQRAVLAMHWGWDIGAWQLTRELSRDLGATAVGGRWSRLLIDLNRRADDPTLIRSTAEETDLPWNLNLTPQQVERRIQTYHTPYHIEVDRLILRRIVRGVRPLLFAVHTFTPVLHGRPRPFDIGILFEHHRGLAYRLGRSLRQQGLSVRYNQPYSGLAGMMYAVDRHGSHHGLPCLELEVNQRLFEPGRSITRLAAAVARGIRTLLPATMSGTRGR